MALKLKPVIAARAKEKQIESGGAVIQKSVKPVVNTQRELAKAAGVSHDTIAKVKTKRSGAPSLTEAARKKKGAQDGKTIHQPKSPADM